MPKGTASLDVSLERLYKHLLLGNRAYLILVLPEQLQIQA
jgi:hypothetical protein